MKVVRISSYEEFKGLKEEWDALLSGNVADNIFLTHEWIDIYVKHFLKGKDLLILKAVDGDRLIGIAPLMIGRYRYFGLPVKVVSFIGTFVSDRMDFIANGYRERAINLMLDYLIRIKKEWDFVDLQEIAEYTGTAEIIKRWLKDRKCTSIFGPSSKNFFVDFNRWDSHKKFSKKFNKEWRQANNKRRSLNLKFERYINKEMDADRLFLDICAIEKHSWQGRCNSGIFSKEKGRNFHKEIFDKFSKNRWIDLSILKLNEKPIAYKYDYIYRKKIYSYNQSFHGRYSYLSPGTMLMLWALKDSAVKGVLEFDFLRGEEEWKARLTQNFKMHDRIRIFKNSLYSTSLYYLQSKVIPCIRRIKIFYRLWMRVKRSLKWD